MLVFLAGLYFVSLLADAVEPTTVKWIFSLNSNSHAIVILDITIKNILLRVALMFD